MEEKKKDERIVNILVAIIIFALVYFMFFICATAQAQEVKRQGNTFVAVTDTTHKPKKVEVFETNYLYVDTNKKVYNIYISANGRAFIWKTSKDGKKYRKYLPKVSEQLQENIK